MTVDYLIGPSAFSTNHTNTQGRKGCDIISTTTDLVAN
jgi:hypothetical protein